MFSSVAGTALLAPPRVLCCGKPDVILGGRSPENMELARKKRPWKSEIEIDDDAQCSDTGDRSDDMHDEEKEDDDHGHVLVYASQGANSTNISP